MFSFVHKVLPWRILTDVESSSSKNTRHSRQHTRFVLDETVESVPERDTISPCRIRPTPRLTYFLKGSVLGAGVLYRMLVTASSALGARGWENAGSGGGALRLLVSLSGELDQGQLSSWSIIATPYVQSNALVESSIGLGGREPFD